MAAGENPPHGMDETTALICGYRGVMSILREEVHQAIDQLPEDELAGILAIVRGYGTPDEPAQRWPLPSWVGAVDSGDPDFSEHSEEYLQPHSPAAPRTEPCAH